MPDRPRRPHRGQSVRLTRNFRLFPDLDTGLGYPNGITIAPVAKTVSMKTARRRSRARKAAQSAAAGPPQPQPVAFALNHGRAWINGDEVGGSDPRFAHLNRSYD
jgi:hypothetical protein